MAFLFNGAQTSDDSTDQKQNIFSAGAEGATSAAGGSSGGQVEKTVIDGGSVSRGTNQASSGSSMGGGTKPVSASQGGYNPKAVQSAYGRIAQSIQLPTQSLGNARSQIQQGQEQLQSESNKYAAAGETQKAGYSLDQATLDRAASGDNAAYSQTSQRLTQAKPEVEAFTGLGEKLPDIGQVRDSAKAYAPEAGPSYTSGQGRFDAALLKRNPEYLRIQQQLLADEASLKKENDTAVADKTTAQRESLGKAYDVSTTDIKDRLGGLSKGIVSAAQVKETAEDSRRGALDETTIAQQEYAKLKEQIRADLKTADPRSQEYRSAKYLDSLSPAELLKNNVSIDRDTDWREFIDQSGADRYNRVEGLLGTGSMLTPAQMGAGADYTFDRANAYQTIKEQITGQRGEADRQAQSEIDLITKAAKDRAKGYSEGDLGRDARSQAEQEIAAYARQKYGTNETFGDLAQLHAQDLFGNDALYQGMTDKGLIRDNQATDWAGALSAEEASRMNALTQDIGGLENYGAGGTYKPEYDIEALKAYYDQYVSPYMSQYRNQYAPPTAAKPTGKTSKGQHQR